MKSISKTCNQYHRKKPKAAINDSLFLRILMIINNPCKGILTERLIELNFRLKSLNIPENSKYLNLCSSIVPNIIQTWDHYLPLTGNKNGRGQKTITSFAIS